MEILRLQWMEMANIEMGFDVFGTLKLNRDIKLTQDLLADLILKKLTTVRMILSKYVRSYIDSSLVQFWPILIPLGPSLAHSESILTCVYNRI